MTEEVGTTLDQAQLEIAIALGSAGITAFRNTLFGQPTPRQQNYHRRASNPKPGDLVVETTSFASKCRASTHPEWCVGTLVAHAQEFIKYDEINHTEGEPDGYHEEAWYIKLLVEESPVWDSHRWINCEFIAIPRTPQEAYQWERDEEID